MVLDFIPGIPRDENGPVFAAPWQAQAFAMALTLQQRGIFTWAEWADTLGTARAHAATAGAPDTGETYFRDWLATLEQMATRGLADAAALTRTRDAWGRAAERTPHGAPIELGGADFVSVFSDLGLRGGGRGCRLCARRAKPSGIRAGTGR